jgi:hypothetical protein
MPQKIESKPYLKLRMPVDVSVEIGAKTLKPYCMAAAALVTEAAMTIKKAITVAIPLPNSTISLSNSAFIGPFVCMAVPLLLWVRRSEASGDTHLPTI